MNYDNTPKSLTILPLFPCHFVEFPDNKNHEECSIANSSICARCPILGRFLFGGTVTDDGAEGPGHVVSLLEWVLTLLFGTFGIITNCLIITIIWKRKSRKPFDLLLIALACLDFIGSITSIMASSATVALLGKNSTLRKNTNYKFLYMFATSF